MGSEWQVYRLGDLVDIFDGPHATPVKIDTGPIFLGISNLENGRLELGSTTHLSEEDYVKWTRRVIPQEGDVVFSYETRLGEAAIIPAGLKCCLGRRMGLLRTKGSRVDPRFLLYSYLSDEFQETIRSRTMHGSTVDRIPLIEMPDFPIRVPSLETQRAIAHILGALDDKIELNRQMNQTLEAIARALFKSWFVDFDPVWAKAAGEQPPGLAPHIADLFPDEFVDSELGEIPKGWEIGRLSTIIDEVRDTVQPEDIKSGTPYIALEHMPRHCIALNTWDIADDIASAKRRFKAGDILFGKLRPYFHKVGPAPLDGVCSTDIVVCRPKDDLWYGLTLGHLSSDAFVAYTNSGSTGTKMPRTNWRYMSAYQIAIPPSQVASQFSEIVHPMIERIRNSIFEQQTLAALRDTLLPKLISGELRVPEGFFTGLTGFAGFTK